ncbi:MAG: MerR family transcriptional regulator, partial [Acidimicrobiales bacterium]
MANRSHLSIGEVLSLLHEEFPDVTISKIRFLEGQGLVDPERTPSGYRKFYETDIERLRWVLRQQRDAFLPLKVIKGRLDERVSPSTAPSAPIDDPSDRPARRFEAVPSSGAGPGGAGPGARGGRRHDDEAKEGAGATGLEHRDGGDQQ